MPERTQDYDLLTHEVPETPAPRRGGWLAMAIGGLVSGVTGRVMETTHAGAEVVNSVGVHGGFSVAVGAVAGKMVDVAIRTGYPEYSDRQSRTIAALVSTGLVYTLNAYLQSRTGVAVLSQMDHDPAFTTGMVTGITAGALAPEIVRPDQACIQAKS